MEYRIQILDEVTNTWMNLSYEFDSWVVARATAGRLYPHDFLNQSLGLPAQVRIWPERVHDGTEAQRLSDMCTESVHHGGECSCEQSEAALDLFLDLAVNHDWTDEDAEIAAGRTVRASVYAGIEQDWRDAHIMDCGLAEAYEFIGDPIDNAVACYLTC